MCCPFHGDKHPSMKVDSRFHCFACQADGDVIDFVGRLFQLSPYKAVEKLKNDFGMALADGKVRLALRRPPTVRQQLLDYYRCLQRWREQPPDMHRSHPQKNFTPASLKR